MSGNIKFRWFLIAPLLVVLFVVVTSPVISWAGELEDAQKKVRQNPNDADAHYNLGYAYDESGLYQKAIASYKEALRINPDHADAHYNLGITYRKSGQYRPPCPDGATSLLYR